MLIVFPSFPGRPREPDSSFAVEADAARAAGFRVGFVDVELNFGGEVKLRGLPEGGGRCLYRGWILKVADYAKLVDALRTRDLDLVTSVDDYRTCYEFPRWYADLSGDTPASIVFEGREFDLDRVAAAVEAAFASKPVILKDFLKSRKHEWFDACFIRDASSADEVKRVVQNFLRLQEDSFEGGLVFRQFVDFKGIGLHTKSRMPLVKEVRCFVWKGEVFYAAPYWAEGAYDGDGPDTAEVEALAAKIKSPFFAIDVAERESGGWLVIEVNDGGSAGVPEGGDIGDFYCRLAGVASI